MKETGIIMSGNHPKLVLDGTKTQTRRVINPKPMIVLDGTPIKIREAKPNEFPIQREDIKCPYGQVGDRLWVRETHKIWVKEGFDFWYALYKDGMGQECNCSVDAQTDDIWYRESAKWRPSIHMPRWASRITLEITEVRVERVQEISPEDVRSEGIRGFGNLDSTNMVEFIQLWDSLNAKRGYGWEVNPWCWCISFKAVDK